MKIGLISCTKQKQDGSWPAEELYISPGFSEHLSYAKKHYDHVFVVSARYGFVDLTQILPKYDRALVLLDDDEQEAWAVFIVACLRQYLKEQGEDEKSVQVFVHADELYCRRLHDALTRVKIPCHEVDFFGQLPF